MADQPRDRARLPLSVVRYGRSFCGFSRRGSKTWHLCECSIEPLNNLITSVRRSAACERNDSEHIHSRIFSELCKRLPAEPSFYSPNATTENVLDQLSFQSAICHLCNRITPSAQYEHPMYVGSFRARWGWYVDQQTFLRAYGVDDFITPKHVTDDYRSTYMQYMPLYSEWLTLRDRLDDSDSRIRYEALEIEWTKLSRHGVG
jgi:hypothetical protein